MDDRTPVLVGVGTAVEREGGADPWELMEVAARAAGDDAGGQALLSRVGMILTARGTWSHPDPGRWLGDRLGAAPRTLVAELGILQSTIIARAAGAIADGSVEVALVVGGEAAASARRQGQAARIGPAATAEGAPPDEVLAPHGQIISDLEISRAWYTPAHQYAMIERSLGRSPDELDRTWSAWSEVATTNPDAWRRERIAPADLAWGSPTNPPVSAPYGRRHCSQINVDQAAALLLCSAGTARSLGIPRDRWVFPTLAAESNLMIPVPARARIGESPGFVAVRGAIEQHCGLSPADFDVVELYSCFPSAVEVQRRGLGIDAERICTVTGGMSFAGGPFNHFVFQSTAVVVRHLRARGEGTALVTAISGMITKQGAVAWALEPPARPFAAVDVTDLVAAAAPVVRLAGDPTDAAAERSGVVAGSTVVADASGLRAWALVDLPDGSRTLASHAGVDGLAAEWVTRIPDGDAVVVRGAEFAQA